MTTSLRLDNLILMAALGVAGYYALRWLSTDMPSATKAGYDLFGASSLETPVAWYYHLLLGDGMAPKDAQREARNFGKSEINWNEITTFTRGFGIQNG